MSGKRKQSTLSQSSNESSADEAASNKKSRLAQLSGSSSSSESGSDDGSPQKRKSRSRSSGGSDSGSARSKSSSKSRSRSKSAASRKSRSGSDRSGSRSRSRSSSPAKSRSQSREGSKKSNSSREGSAAAASRKSSSAASHSSSSDKSSKSDSSASSRHSDSSSKSKKLKKSKDHKASSKLQRSISDSHSDDEDPVEKKRIPKKGKKAVAESSPNIQASWRDEFDDGLDDDYIGDDEDRRMLETMTEREREEEYYRRAEKREELRKRFEISQKLKNQKKREESETEQMDQREDDTMTSLPSDPGTRKKGYEEKYGKKFSALNELKAKREERERKEKVREERQKKNKKNPSDSESSSDFEKIGRSKKKNVLKASEIYSSSSSDDGKEVRRKSSSSSASSSSGGESDTERQNSKKTVKKAMNIETKEELEKIRLSRYRLDKIVHLPIFKKTVIGCFVRVGIGNNEKSEAVYRCCEIIDTVETAKVYTVMKTKTNVGLKLRHGKDTRMFRCSFVSNSPLSDTEFMKWKKACAEGNLNLPTVAHMEQKEKDIKYAIEYRFSSFDVEKILASKKKFDNSPKNFAMKKAELTKERDKAQMEGRQEDTDKLNRELLSLEERAEDLDRQRTSTISTLAIINNRNRKNNVDRAYQGIWADEKRRRDEGQVDDPFTRRKTRPKLSDGKKATEPEMTTELLMKLELERKKKAEEEKKKKENSILPPPVDISKNAAKLKAELKNVDIFDAHNFDLDINVDTIQSTPLTPSISLKPVTASSTPTGPTKRSLKLDEWKKKRGII